MRRDELLGALILEVFHLNNVLTRAGDEIVGDLGLTSTRWQVLGTISRAQVDQPVANLARTMGQSRQGVQRIVNELAQTGFVEFAPNPHHRRAQLVTVTPKGQKVYNQAMEARRDMLKGVGDDVSEDEMAAVVGVLGKIRRRLEG